MLITEDYMNPVWKSQTFDILFTFKTNGTKLWKMKKMDAINRLVFNNVQF